MNAMGKKLLSLLLVLTMLVGLMPAVFASEEVPAEPEEQAEEMLPEEENDAEDPVDAEEPGDAEDPADPEIPAETPEEPGDDPNAPTEPGEEPETPEEPGGEPEAEEPAEEEPAAEPEEPEDGEFDMDIEIQSEGLGERKLTPTNDLSFLQFHRYGLGEEMFDGESIFVQIQWTGTDPKLAYAIVAESKTMRYFIDYHPKKDLIVNTPLKPGEGIGRYYINLPAGEYTIRVIAWDPDIATPTYFASAQEKTLIILPAPEVLAVTPASEDNDGCIILKDPYNTDILYLVKGETDMDKHTTVLPDLACGEYWLRYRCFDTVPTQPGNPNAVVLDSAWTYVSVPYQTWAYYFSASFDESVEYNSGTEVYTLYKGEEAKISTYIDGEDARLSFKSNNSKVVTVDAVGNVKAVGTGDTTVTVTSLADAYPGSIDLKIHVEDFAPKTFKFEKAMQRVEWNMFVRLCGEYPYILLQTDDAYKTAPVTFEIVGEGAYFRDESSTYVTALTTTSKSLRVYTRSGGTFTVTATLHGKTTSCTLQVDGFTASDNNYAYPTEESVYYSGGKPVKGWIAWDNSGELYLFGKDALAGGLAKLANRRIYYADASGRLLSEGYHKIDGKLYLFDDNLELVTGTSEGLTSISGEQVYQDAAGHLRTGWQKKSNGNPVYLDPDYGYLVTCSWVPYGKGVTWVDCDGDNMDADFHVLQNEKGFHVHMIDLDYDTENNDGVPYAFVDGVRYTGWVYADAEENYTTKATKNSRYKLYFDPNLSGELKYLDPNNNGQIKIEFAKSFWVDGKEYRYASADSQKGVLLPAAAGQSAKTNLLIDQKDAENSTHYWASAPDGSVIKSAMVDVYDLRGGEKGAVYARSDGSLARNEWVMVGGKSYYFGDDYMLQTAEITNTGLRVKINSDYFTEDSSYATTDVTAKPVNANKPKEGYFYYYNGEKLKNCILYQKDYENLWHPSLALDKNGKPQKGPAVVTAYPYLDAPATESYVVSMYGYVKYGRVEHYETNSVSISEVKGKLYASYSDGTVLKDGIYTYYYRWNVGGTFWADKNGVLPRNTFKTIDAGKIYFNEDGLIEDGGYDYSFTVKGKTYHVESKHSTEFDRWFWVIKTNPSYLYNKDGSVKFGWVTYPDGKKHYVCPCKMDSFLYPNIEFPRSRLWKIDGKLYCLDSRGVMQTGWMNASGTVEIWDMATFIETDGYYGQIGEINGALYFDPKTGAAVTGGWKSVPTLLFTEAQEKAFDRNYNIVPLDNTEKNTKYYFKEDGTIASEEELVIGGKTYWFNWDGTSSGLAGWVDAEKTQYRLKSGELASGRTKIDNLWYYFDAATGVKVSEQLRKTGSKWYYYNEAGTQDTVDVCYDWLEGRYTFGSTTGKNLRFVWNKDGSLAKIVYAANGQPAAGESVSFGYDMAALVDGTGCGFVLDSKGLPMTGVVSGFNPGEGASSLIPGHFDTCSIVVNADGSRLVCRNDMPSFVKIGNNYYVMVGALVDAPGRNMAGWDDTFDYSLLPAADRTLLEQWLAVCNGGLALCMNADGSLPQNTAVQVTGWEYWGTVHVGRLGLCLESVGLYKSGSKWFLNKDWYSTGVYNAYDFNNDSYVQIEIRVKDNGELTGFYDYKTGKTLTGKYKLYDILYDIGALVVLKNGKPQPGKLTNPADGRVYDLPKEIGWIYVS